MKKIIVFNMVTVDGYFAGVSEDLSWHNTDDEFQEFAKQQIKDVGTILFGRVTYDMMESFWTSEHAIKTDPIVSSAMNNTPKIVFSRTMGKADWNNAKLMKEINVDEIRKWKEVAGKDLFIFGSGKLVQEFENLGLIDEYRLIINPVILGSGRLLFKDIKNKANLKLLKTKEFKNGNVLLYYERLK